MSDDRYPAHLDFFSQIVNVHWTGAGRLLLTFSTEIEVTGSVQPECKTPTFTLGDEVALLDQIVSCRKVTIPEHTVNVRTWMAWSANAPPPSLATYNLLLHTNGSLQVLYGAQFSQEISMGGPFFTVDTFPSLLHPSASGFYNSAASCQAYCDELTAFSPIDTNMRYFDTLNNVIGPFPRVAYAPVFVDVPTVIPAVSTSIFTGRYLFSIPNFVAQTIARIIGADDSEVTGTTYHRKVNSIRRLPATPDDTAFATRIGDVDYTVTTQPVTGSPTTWTVSIIASALDDGGGGG